MRKLLSQFIIAFCWLVIGGVPAYAASFSEQFADFQNAWQKEAQQELEIRLSKLKSTASGAQEVAHFNYCTGQFHFIARRYGSALEALELARLAFQTTDPKKAIDSQVFQAYCYRDLGQTDTAIVIANAIVDAVQTLNYLSVMGSIYHLRGTLQGRKGQMETALEDYSLALKYARQTGDSLTVATTLDAQTLVYYKQGDFKSALQANLAAGKILQKNSPPSKLASNYNRQGSIYCALEKTGPGKKAFEMALEIAETHDLTLEAAAALNNLAILAEINGDTLSALRYYKNSLTKVRAFNHLYALATATSNIANLYFHLKEYELALQYETESLDYSTQMDDSEGQVFSLYRIGKIKKFEQNIDEAIGFLNRADTLANSVGAWDRIWEIHACLSGIYEDLGDPQRALFHHKKMTVAKDSVEMLEATKYADSLLLSQPVTAEETQPKAPLSFLWWGVTLVGIVLLAIAGYKIGFRQSSRSGKTNVDYQTEHAAKAVTGLRENQDWAAFFLQFETIYPGLLDRLAQRHEKITPTDLRVLALSRMGLSVAELADLMFITPESAKKARQRTRKRLELSSETTLLHYLLTV